VLVVLVKMRVPQRVLRQLVQMQAPPLVLLKHARAPV
jgi:hypothetical protein